MKLFYCQADEEDVTGQFRLIEFLLEAPSLRSAKSKAKKFLINEWPDCEPEIKEDGSIKFDYNSVTISNIEVFEISTEDAIKKFLRTA